MPPLVDSIFNYIPITPQVKVYILNPCLANLMSYCSQFTYDPNEIGNIFGGSHY
ncbi:hypothetical protein BS47DRAFT_1403443 [Hydnum rufescens UP504]|uniref:Uncharacterized protein n=1 Tax=Hydnum rufescens UP504 TaxID=1448309 RepID=A0A9P6DKQ1_9AGAM|nr:hypothetical protein BS47DRAFT_1403443 [Hydnum rufescens UP504]